MNNEPKTYKDIILNKRMYELVKTYDLSKKVYDLIYKFMKENPNGRLECGANYITLMLDGEVIQYIDAPNKRKTQVDGITWQGDKFVIIPHVVVSSGGGGSSGGWSSSGGGSSNNNNNNNNNNR